MRPLKFRLWDFEEEEMIPADALAFEEYMPLVHQLNQPGMMEFTGFLTDNNEEIYEGDLVLRHRNADPLSGEVIFHNGSWLIKDTDGQHLLSLFAAHCHVVGHIFEEREA